LNQNKGWEDLQIIRKVIVWMMDRADSKLQGYSEIVHDTLDYLRAKYPPASDKLVNSVLNSLNCAELLHSGVYVYLEAVERDNWVVPILSFKVDLSDASNPEVRFRVGVVFPANKNLGREICAVGFRFETPEGSKGRHSFYHAQPFRSFEWDGVPLPACPEWFPAEHPAIPLGAEDAVELLACCLGSLYEPDLLEDIVSGLDEATRKKLRASFIRLALLQP
jgi:hypothetical protein